jgi:hypothetical protein
MVRQNRLMPILFCPKDNTQIKEDVDSSEIRRKEKKIKGKIRFYSFFEKN